MICEFCENTEAFVIHKAREMMLGTRDTFDYLECTNCGCVRISSVPHNLGDYYPPDKYYSLNSPVNWRAHVRRSVLKIALLHDWLYRVSLMVRSFLSAKLVKLLELEQCMKMRILDVGSGAALFVKDLRAVGFSRAMGVDPFIAVDIYDDLGLVVKKGFLADLDDGWDRIIFIHSFEHIPDQVGTLRLVRAKLSASGVAIISMPIASWAWKHYGTDWVQLDAPRHLCLHTEQSFRIAASKAGFTITKVVYDSSAFQFFGSELYRRDVPWKDFPKNLRRYFSASELARFRQRAIELNDSGVGDQAVFFLCPTGK